mgnify:FL=1|jgi:hypothetical protein
MFLEPWMIGVLALTVGLCAVWNRHMGFRIGAMAVLEKLETEKIISVSNEGEIMKYKQLD